jgi:hypothetical protein
MAPGQLHLPHYPTVNSTALALNHMTLIKLRNLESNIHADEKYLYLTLCMLKATGDSTKDSFCD